MNTRTLCLALLAFAISACSNTHSLTIPDGLDKANAAVIRAWSPASGNVLVQTLDGNRFQDGRVSHLYVRPGTHKITARWADAHYSTDSHEMTVRVQAGHYYVVQATPDMVGRTVSFAFVDKGTDYDEACLIPRPFEPGGVRGRNC
jgi:hypothetical protein